MPISLFCSVCNVKVEVPDRMAGKSSPCPSCGNVIDIPSPDRAHAGSRMGRKLRGLLPWLLAGAALVGLAAAFVSISELHAARQSLDENLKDLRAKLSDLESRAVAGARPAAPADPTPAPKPAASDTHDALQREIAALHGTDEELLRKLQELDGEIVRLRGTPATPAPKPVEVVETADDEDIEIKIDAKQDPLAPRPRFTFTGHATNTGSKQAPVVLISIRVIGFQGLNPVTRQPVTTAAYAATLTERIRSLPPGTTANVMKELYPTDAALLSREVVWSPQFEVSAKVQKN
jgi:hypothetical protein